VKREENLYSLRTFITIPTVFHECRCGIDPHHSLLQTQLSKGGRLPYTTKLFHRLTPPPTLSSSRPALRTPRQIRGLKENIYTCPRCTVSETPLVLAERRMMLFLAPLLFQPQFPLTFQVQSTSPLLGSEREKTTPKATANPTYLPAKGSSSM